MKVNWIIDECAELVTPEFYEQCTKLGHNVFTLNSKNGDLLIFDNLQRRKPTVCIGPMSICHKVNQTRPEWIPGYYRDLDRLKCSDYIPYTSRLLLNHNYFFLPLKDIPNQYKNIKRNFCILDDRIFIRPNKCNKVFSGQTISTQNLEWEIKVLQDTYKVDDTELCLVSENRASLIDFEFRFVVVDGKVVAGSMYKPEEKTVKYRHPAFQFAQKCADLYLPENVFTLDICELKSGDYKLVELNSFSCAGLYKCDYEDVIKSVSRQAKLDYKDIYTK
jgi:hypothetical protein